MECGSAETGAGRRGLQREAGRVLRDRRAARIGRDRLDLERRAARRRDDAEVAARELALRAVAAEASAGGVTRIFAAAYCEHMGGAGAGDVAVRAGEPALEELQAVIGF